MDKRHMDKCHIVVVVVVFVHGRIRSDKSRMKLVP
jgi:hypothetical protein